MTHRTNAANALRDAGHFSVRPTFAKFFKAAKLDDVKLRVGNIAGIVHVNADLGVTFNASHRINDNAF